MYNSVKIYDSLKLLNFSVKAIAESFNLDMKKGEIDYKKHREKGYKPTAEEWEYIYNDIKIVGKALKIFLMRVMIELQFHHVLYLFIKK